jgi:hypothetical protein
VNKKLQILSVMILIVINILVWNKAIGEKSNVLSASSTADESINNSEKEESIPTETPIPTLTLTPTKKIENTPIPTKSPTKTPEPTNNPNATSTPIPPLTGDSAIHAAIERFAGQYDLDPNVLRHLATCESGFNDKAVNGSYGGLFQFTEGSWVSNRNIMGEDPNTSLRFNIEEATQTAAYMIATGKSGNWPNCMP